MSNQAALCEPAGGKATECDPVQAVFVYLQGNLGDTKGGVQICTREYFKTLEAAGFSLHQLEIPVDRRFWTRVRRRLNASEYHNLFDCAASVRRVVEAVGTRCEWVFLNHRMLAPLAGAMRAILPAHVRLVLLSHGLASADYIHEIRGFGTGLRNAMSTCMLGQRILDEVRQNRHFDHVFCLAPFEVEIERWLGARSVSFLPRQVRNLALAWKPVSGRIGFVGRLDHPPNEEGLVLFLEALERIAPSWVHLRVVGAPEKAGQRLLRNFPCCQYLGVLSHEELEQEAATWQCLVHPLFCYARGCSTKLAVAIGWQIPIVTTSTGCRGYVWRRGRIPIADDPESLARLALDTLEPERAKCVRAEICEVSDTSPTCAEVASLVRCALLASNGREPRALPGIDGTSDVAYHM